MSRHLFVFIIYIWWLKSSSCPHALLEFCHSNQEVESNSLILFPLILTESCFLWQKQHWLQSLRRSLYFVITDPCLSVLSYQVRNVTAEATILWRSPSSHTEKSHMGFPAGSPSGEPANSQHQLPGVWMNESPKVSSLQPSTVLAEFPGIMTQQ